MVVPTKIMRFSDDGGVFESEHEISYLQLTSTTDCSNRRAQTPKDLIIEFYVASGELTLKLDSHWYRARDGRYEELDFQRRGDLSNTWFETVYGRLYKITGATSTPKKKPILSNRIYLTRLDEDRSEPEQRAISAIDRFRGTPVTELGEERYAAFHEYIRNDVEYATLLGSGVIAQSHLAGIQSMGRALRGDQDLQGVVTARSVRAAGDIPSYFTISRLETANTVAYQVRHDSSGTICGYFNTLTDAHEYITNCCRTRRDSDGFDPSGR